MNLEKQLSLIEDNLRKITRDKTTLSVFIDTKDIDNTCQEIGRNIINNETKILDLCQKPFTQNLNVYITGALYYSGGHTREIEGWINNIYDNRKNIIIVSCPIIHSHKKQLDKLKSQNIEIIYNNSGYNRVEYIKWLQYQLAELRPSVIFVSTTPTDIISLCALQPQLIDKLYWNLSLDHGVSIGLHIKSITSIIVKRPYLYFYLKDQLKLSKLVYIPLNRPDITGNSDISDDKEKKIITGSCTSAHHKIEINYKYRFTEIIPNILKITDGQHIHIGDISQNGLKNLYLNMDKLGIDRSKFIRIEHVESLAKSLIENDLDILIQTFPIGGGLVTIEAMGAGKMIINHKNYSSYLLTSSDFCYVDAFSWSAPEELYDYLNKLTRQDIIKQGKIARKYYEKYHMSENLKEIFNATNLTGIEPENKREFITHEYNYAIDYYQRYFDDNAYLNLRSSNKSFGRKIKFICKKGLNSIILLVKKLKIPK